MWSFKDFTHNTDERQENTRGIVQRWPKSFFYFQKSTIGWVQFGSSVPNDKFGNTCHKSHNERSDHYRNIELKEKQFGNNLLKIVLKIWFKKVEKAEGRNLQVLQFHPE